MIQHSLEKQAYGGEILFANASFFHVELAKLGHTLTCVKRRWVYLSEV